MKSFTILSALMGLNSLASAHMDLCYPPSLRYQFNPNVPSNLIDYSLTSPLKPDGSDFPCKGYQSDLGSAAGASVATWAVGGTYNFTVGGDARHNGGSCQISLSYDKGKSFTVIHSYVGGCPLQDTYNFVLPADAPTGAALFAWTWFNEVGNREMYMNCASITITGSGSTKRAGTSFSSRPSLFVANLNNGCNTVAGEDVTFPDTGPDVTTGGTSLGSVTGTCKAVNGIGDFSSASGSTATSSAGAPAGSPSSSSAYGSSANTSAGTTATVVSSAAAQSSGGSQTVATSSAAATSSTGTSSTTLSLSSDGSCGGSHTCQGSVHGSCCSQWGWCGSTSAYCGTGCQSAFGTCGAASSNTTLQISTDQTCGGTTSNTCQGSTYGNCCSQYGYCGSTNEFCGTGCQGGFGTCGQASSGVSISVSSGRSTSTPPTMAASFSSATSPSTSPTTSTSTSTSSQNSLIFTPTPRTTAATVSNHQIITVTSGIPTTHSDYVTFTATPRISTDKTSPYQKDAVPTDMASNSATTPGFVGVTESISQATTFITVVKPSATTSTTASTYY